LLEFRVTACYST